MAITLASQVVFYFGFGATFESYFSLLCSFTSVFALGVVWTVYFVVIQDRVPASKLGSSLNIAGAAMQGGAILGQYFCF